MLYEYPKKESEVILPAILFYRRWLCLVCFVFSLLVFHAFVTAQCFWHLDLLEVGVDVVQSR